LANADFENLSYGVNTPRQNTPCVAVTLSLILAEWETDAFSKMEFRTRHRCAKHGLAPIENKRNHELFNSKFKTGWHRSILT
jgi:hypothetical protein